MPKPPNIKKGKPKSDFAVESGEEALDDLIINIHGVPGVGKTFAALSLDPSWPKDIETRSRKSKKVVLKNTFHIGWDRAALAGLTELNMSVKYHVDARQFLRDQRGNMLQRIGVLLEKYQETIENNPDIKIVIHDTVSRLDTLLYKYWHHTDNTPRSHNGDPDTRPAFGRMLTCHRMYQDDASDLPGGVTAIFLFHQKTVNEEAKFEKQTEKAKRLIVQMGDRNVFLVPEVTGQGLSAYTGDASLELVCTAANNPKTGGVTRYLWPAVVDGQRAKNRFQHTLVGKQPADLGLILKKIRGS